MTNMRVLALVVSIISLTMPAQAQTFVGVLEERVEGGPPARVVRAAFEKAGDAWRALPIFCGGPACGPEAYPAIATWTIAFDGRSLGTVSAHRPTRYRYFSDAGLLDITPNSVVPTIGARSMDYAGWVGEPVLRPLVAVSAPHAEDPQQWRRGHLSAARASIVRRAFRARFPVSNNCTDAYENRARPVPYADQDIRIARAYNSAHGWSLAELSLQGYQCDGPADSEFAVQTVVLSPAGEPRFLSEGLRLVDAGDYDGDDSSELVFAIDRYDRGGYEMYADDFNEHAVFEYSYH